MSLSTTDCCAPKHMGLQDGYMPHGLQRSMNPKDSRACKGMLVWFVQNGMHADKLVTVARVDMGAL